MRERGFFPEGRRSHRGENYPPFDTSINSVHRSALGPPFDFHYIMLPSPVPFPSGFALTRCQFPPATILLARRHFTPELDNRNKFLDFNNHGINFNDMTLHVTQPLPAGLKTTFRRKPARRTTSRATFAVPAPISDRYLPTLPKFLISRGIAETVHWKWDLVDEGPAGVRLEAKKREFGKNKRVEE